MLNSSSKLEWTYYARLLMSHLVFGHPFQSQAHHGFASPDSPPCSLIVLVQDSMTQANAAWSMSQVFSWYTDSSDPLPRKKKQQRDSNGLKAQVASVTVKQSVAHIKTPTSP